jgi:hypothetical protein
MARIFGLLATVLAMAAGLYIYSRQGQTLAASAPGGNPQGYANITGVKNDLIAIANAERGFNIQEGRYGSIDELNSGKYITIRGERDNYTYDVQTTSSGFRVTATRSGDGTPSQLWIDETMQVQSSN